MYREEQASPIRDPLALAIELFLLQGSRLRRDELSQIIH